MDLVYLTFRDQAILGVCLNDGRLDELPASGMAEIILLTDLQQDGRDEILFGGDTVSIGYHLVGLVRRGRIHQIDKANGKPFILISGYGFDGGGHPGALERAFGCEDVDRDGVDEFVQVKVRRKAETTWSKAGFEIRRGTAARIFVDAGSIDHDYEGVARDLVTPCEMTSF